MVDQSKEQLPGTHDFLSGGGNAVPAQNVPVETPPVLEKPMADVVPEQFANIALDPDDPLSKELADMESGATPQQTVQPQQEKVVTPQQAVQPQLTPEEQQRFNYWQSERDKEHNKVVKLEDDLQRMTPYMPLIDAIEKNPNLLDVLETASKGEKIEAPVQPQIPVGYNLEEANEPGTESHKYNISLENWRNDAVLYQNKLIENMQTQQQEQRQNETQRQEQVLAKQEMQTNLVNQYGLTPDIADKFIGEMSAPQSKNEANLIRLFYLNHPELRQQMLPAIQRLNNISQPYLNPAQINTPQGQQQLAQRVNQMQNQQIPPSVVLGQGANPPQLSEEQKFNQGLLQTQEVDF